MRDRGGGGRGVGGVQYDWGFTGSVICISISKILAKDCQGSLRIFKDLWKLGGGGGGLRGGLILGLFVYLDGLDCSLIQ